MSLIVSCLLNKNMNFKSIQSYLANRQLYTSANNNNNLEKKIREIDQVYTKGKNGYKGYLLTRRVIFVVLLSSMHKKIHLRVHITDRTKENKSSFAWVRLYNNRTRQK
jgi:CHASE3 domain sensor protein